MSKQLRIRLIKYGGSVLFVAALAYVYLSSRWEIFLAAPMVEKYLMLCDALTIPGMLLIMFGALVWVSNMGALDGIAYALVFTFRSLVPGLRRARDEKYADYVERRRERPVRGYGFLLISGGVTMAIALVFMMLWQSMYTS